MSEFPRINGFPDPLVTICTYSIHSVGGTGTLVAGSIVSSAYPAANLAIFIPFRIAKPVAFSNLFSFNGATVSGNIDIGIYSTDGTKIVSTGSTTQAGTSAIQTIAVTTTEIDSGLFYLAVAMDNTTGMIEHMAPTNAAFQSFFGMAQMASAFPLPATATFATITNSYVPSIGLTSRSFV